MPRPAARRIPKYATQGPGSTVFFHIPYDERVEGDTLSSTFYDSANDYRLWKVDLESEETTEITSIDYFNGIRFSFTFP